MTEIRFYHLLSQTLEQALPALLSKAYENGHKILVKLPEDKISFFDDTLWSYKPDSFLPHGSHGDKYPEYTPILLVSNDDNLNNADLLILTHNLDSEKIGDYELCCEIFDGRNDTDVQKARHKWKLYKEEGHSVTYWQQTPQGGWEKRA